MAFWPAIMAAHEVGNATMMENPMIGCFTEAQAGYRWAPLALWFVPAAIGTAAVVIRLKFVDSSE